MTTAYNKSDKITNCNWCGEPCKRRTRSGSAYCGKKCSADMHASRKGAWTTIESICLWIDQGLECVGCSRRVPIDLTDNDHIVPRKRGGDDKIGNAQVLCSACNRSKGQHPMDHFMEHGLRWTGAPSLTYKQAVDALLFYCRHKKIKQRIRAILDDRIEGVSYSERWSAEAVLDWLNKQEQN